MCMMLYMAANRELPLVKLDDNNNICIEELWNEVSSVKDQFNKPHVYYVGSYQGCGCGFAYGQIDFDSSRFSDKDAEFYVNLMNSAREEEKKRKSSVTELFEYIKRNLEDGNKIDLYSCWAGKERGIPEHKLEIKLSDFVLGERFRFEENQFICISL